MGFKIAEGSTKRLHDLSDEAYFGDAYKEYLSNSSIKSLNPEEGGSAYLFKNRVGKEGDSLELGTAIHRMVLEGDKYVLSEVEKPSGKLGKLVDKAFEIFKGPETVSYTKAMVDAMAAERYYADSLTEERAHSAIAKGKDYFEFLLKKDENPNLIVLTPELKYRLQKAVSTISNNRSITDLLKPSSEIFNIKSYCEDVIISDWLVECEGKVVKIPVKGKLDNWSIDFDNKVLTINDLKTTSSPVQKFMGFWQHKPEDAGGEVLDTRQFSPGSFQKWHYYRQMSMYSTLLIHSCEEEFNVDFTDWTINVNMIVAETIEPFNAHCYPVSESWLEYGKKELSGLLYRYAWHELNGWDKVMELV